MATIHVLVAVPYVNVVMIGVAVLKLYVFEFVVIHA